MADGSEKIWKLEEIIEICKSHNCRYVIAPHPIDDKSSFEHYHCGINTGNSNFKPAQFAGWFGLPVNACEKIHSRFDFGYINYLLHHNQEGKTEINPEKLIKNFDIDFTKLFQRIDDNKRTDDMLNMLARGEITEYDLYKAMNEEWCRKHTREINSALVTRSKKIAINGGKREMDVVYITGGARCGKSYLAQKLCKMNNMSYYSSSNGEHPFDDYMGQDVVILDDLRPHNFRFSELLKVLDNHMSSKVSARYHNVDLNCKIMYITSVLQLNEFYKGIADNNHEAVEQLRGRIKYVYEVEKDTVTIYALCPDNYSYKQIQSFPNPIKLEPWYGSNVEEQKTVAREMLGSMLDMMGDIKKAIDNHSVDELKQLTIDDIFTENPFKSTSK